MTHAPSLEVMKQGFAARGFELTPNNLRQVRVPGRGRGRCPTAPASPPASRSAWARPRPSSCPAFPGRCSASSPTTWPPAWPDARPQRGLPPAAVRTFHVYGMGESHIDHRLAGLLDGARPRPPGSVQVALHYRTAAPENHVKLVVRGPDAARNQARARAARRRGAPAAGARWSTASTTRPSRWRWPGRCAGTGPRWPWPNPAPAATPAS